MWYHFTDPEGSFTFHEPEQKSQGGMHQWQLLLLSYYAPLILLILYYLDSVAGFDMIMSVLALFRTWISTGYLTHKLVHWSVGDVKVRWHRISREDPLKSRGESHWILYVGAVQIYRVYLLLWTLYCCVESGNCSSVYTSFTRDADPSRLVDGGFDTLTLKFTLLRYYVVLPMFRTLLARFNEQMLPLFAAIRELTGIQLAPHLLEPDINQYLAEEDKGNRSYGEAKLKTYFAKFLRFFLF